MILHRTHSLTCQVYGPGDDGYDERCHTLNPAVEHRPVAVVEALDAADVRTAVEAASTHPAGGAHHLLPS